MKRLWHLICRGILLATVCLLALDAVTLGLQYPVFGVITTVAATWRRIRRERPTSGKYGTARVSRLDDLLRGNLLGDTGLILGKTGHIGRPRRGRALRALLSPFVASEHALRMFFIAFLGSRWCGDVFIRVPSFTHLLTVSPAGGGKSVNTLLPNLLSYRGACIVIDPKGELYRHSAEHRRKKFGHKIIRIDPAMLCGPGGHSFNPYDFIRVDTKHFVDDCRDLGSMLVVRTGKEHENHFLDSAENVIAAETAFVCACEGDHDSRNLRGMRTFLASRENYAISLEMMEQREGFHGVLQQLGRSLEWHVDRELGSVMSTAQRCTNIFDSPLVADCTNHTTFNPAELRSGKMTIFVIIPADRLVVWAGLQRVLLGTLLRIITRGEPTEKCPVLVLVDECAHIGKMQALEDAITLQRGAGIRIWLFFQSIEQLNKCFGESAGTVLDNLGIQQYFALRSYETAEILSKRIGDETIWVTTQGGNTGTSRPKGGNGQNTVTHSTGTNSTVSETGRRLLMANEILRLPDSVSLVFVDNHPVILAERIKWYSDKAFRRGGTGRSGRLGIKSMFVAWVACLFAVILTAVVVTLPPASARQRGGNPFSEFLNPQPESWFEEPPVTVPVPANRAPQPAFRPIPPARRFATPPVPNRSRRHIYQ